MNRQIMIVDDDPRNIFALKATLKSRGYDVATCTSASEAIERLGANETAIILLDMMMPDMDGYEAIPKLKEKAPGIPIVAVTAQAMTGDREKCLEAGADDYISKPIDVDELVQLLHAYISH
jgi:CheY-like chemotaxis protein